MVKKNLLILACCVVVVFANSLFNGFVGDDDLLINDSKFFHDVSNIQYLVSSTYNTNPDDAFNFDNFSSGSVAYRPVLSLTYFWDYFLWKKNPFGYHLQNMVWHLLNACLIFIFLFYSGKDFLRRLSFWAALLFAVHPLSVEAVCSIGYRADLLASFFVLAALTCYVFGKRFMGNAAGFFYYSLSVLFYGLGLFSKESAIMFPGLIIFYELCSDRKQFRNFFFWGLMAGYGLVCIFYLVVYFFVFPNPALRQISLMGGGVLSHGYYIFMILGYYLKMGIFPWMVRDLPPVFSEDFASVLGRADIIWVVALIGVAVWFRRFRVKEWRGIAFGLGIFFLLYFPVSNILPMLSPLAHRYIYLPAVGLNIFLAKMLLVINDYLRQRRLIQGNFLLFIFCIFCAVSTMSLNTVWKNDFVMARHMIEDFPENPRGYFFSGLYLANHSDRLGSLKYLKKASDLGMEDPRLFFKMGEALQFLGRTEEARQWFYRGIREYPHLHQSYMALGWSFLLSHEPESAIIFLEKALALKPGYEAAGYLIQAYRMSGHDDSAHAVFDKTVPVLKKESEKKSLRVLLEKDAGSFPFIF